MIEFEAVGKTFRDGTAAVVDLNLTVPSDKITVVVGPSGCGKTTTLRMVNRMLEPTSGRIVWDGAPLRSKRKTSLRRQMGYVIQSGGLFPHRTVLENIGTVPALLGWDKNKTRKRSQELLASVGLDRKLAHRYPAQLSGGQQQRVGVARALAADPLVLLMDEPFSAVDPVVRGELHEFFLGLQRELSKTIILITHDIDEAIKLGDQVAILRVGGKLAQAGSPQELLDEPADAFVEGFIGRDRGFRSLSFLPADGLSLGRVKVVRDPDSASGGEPTLVVDENAKPMGWADQSRLGAVFGLGSTFDPESDTLRAALDSALTSPVGLAVAVSGATGRYSGVVSARDILAKITNARASIAESISMRGSESSEQGATAVSASTDRPDAPDSPSTEGSSESEGDPHTAADPNPDERPDAGESPEAVEVAGRSGATAAAEDGVIPDDPDLEEPVNGGAAEPVSEIKSPVANDETSDQIGDEDVITVAGVPVATAPEATDRDGSDRDAPDPGAQAAGAHAAGAQVDGAQVDGVAADQANDHGEKKSA